MRRSPAARDRPVHDWIPVERLWQRLICGDVGGRRSLGGRTAVVVLLKDPSPASTRSVRSLSQGLAHSAFYGKLYVHLRDEMTQAAQAARGAIRGLWHRERGEAAPAGSRKPCRAWVRTTLMARLSPKSPRPMCGPWKHRKGRSPSVIAAAGLPAFLVGSAGRRGESGRGQPAAAGSSARARVVARR